MIGLKPQTSPVGHAQLSPTGVRRRRTDMRVDVSGMQALLCTLNHMYVQAEGVRVCVYMRKGHVSPEERRPSQTSYGDVRDSVPVQIHDSVDGLTEEFHLFAVPACRDTLKRQQKTGNSQRVWFISACDSFWLAALQIYTEFACIFFTSTV